MGNHYAISIHFGSGDTGRKRIERMQELIRIKNFHSKAECIQYCLDQVCDMVLHDNPAETNGIEAAK